ncbi:hypothetical protein LJB89_02825 [Tyzzerella sp. OttesenSCG-928-J15]|nr:hypothetical protein [Tyzzerella sp. OttesenSCG-928-J15]
MQPFNEPAGNRSYTVTFACLPQTMEQFHSLPEAALTEVYHGAALVIPALCLWNKDKNIAIEMLQFLKGPTPLSAYEIQFISDRLKGKDYLPFSYFSGTLPENNYTPPQPYTLIISENRYSYQEKGYVKLTMQSGGADSPRPLQLRQKPSSGQWFLWEQMLLSDIRQPAAADPWA